MEALINRVALMLANGVEESEACLYLVENSVCDADTAGLAIVASRLFLKWANEPVKEGAPSCQLRSWLVEVNRHDQEEG